MINNTRINTTSISSHLLYFLRKFVQENGFNIEQNNTLNNVIQKFT